jgi:hypothetical protein
VRFIQKIIAVLCVLLLANFTLIGCESGHKHDFSNGICSCGDVDWERETAGLEYVELPDGTLEVSNYSGYERRVFIPEKKDGKVITSIGEGAFKGLITLKFVSMPNTITQIKKEAFYSCSGLKSIYIPNGIKSIGEMAFADCNDVITVRYNAISCDNVLIGGKSFYRLGATNKDVKLVIGSEVQKIPNGLM